MSGAGIWTSIRSFMADTSHTHDRAGFFLGDKYLPDFLHYLDSLDMWRKTGQKPEDIKYEQIFRLIPSSEFNPEVIYTRFYLDYNEETRKVLSGEQIVPLSELADVIPSYLKSDAEIKEVRALDGNRVPQYPYIPELDTIKYTPTSVLLKKGDIVEMMRCRNEGFENKW